MKINFLNENKYLNTLYTDINLPVVLKKCSRIPFSKLCTAIVIIALGLSAKLDIFIWWVFCKKKTKNDKIFCVNIVTFLHNLAGSLFKTRQDTLKRMFVKWGKGRKVRKTLHIFILFWLNVFLTITTRLKLKVSGIKNTMTILLTALNAFGQKKAASLLKMGKTFMKLLVAESVEIQCTNVNDLRHILPRKEYQLLNFYINSGKEICRIHYLETQTHLVKQWNW